jgi:hypothetical protein
MRSQLTLWNHTGICSNLLSQPRHGCVAFVCYLLALVFRIIWSRVFDQQTVFKQGGGSHLFLGVCVKLRKATIRFVMSVHLSAWKNSAPTGRIFISFHIWVFSGNLSRKLKLHQFLTIITGTLHEYLCTSMTISRWIILWEMLQTKVVEEIIIHILCSVAFFPKIVPFMRYIEKYGRAWQATDGNIIRRMRFACWITKAADTRSEYVILIALPRQQWSRERYVRRRLSCTICYSDI